MDFRQECWKLDATMFELIKGMRDRASSSEHREWLHGRLLSIQQKWPAHIKPEELA